MTCLGSEDIIVGPHSSRVWFYPIRLPWLSQFHKRLMGLTQIIHLISLTVLTKIAGAQMCVPEEQGVVSL